MDEVTAVGGACPPGSAPFEVGVVILNWNGWRDTVECLDSLLGDGEPGGTIVVCDNGSTEDSRERLRGWAADRFELDAIEQIPAGQPSADGVALEVLKFNRSLPPNSSVPNGRGNPAVLIMIGIGSNLGFARGVNVGLRFLWAHHQLAYVCLLNNDTVVGPGFLGRMARVMQDLPEGTAAVGPKVLDYRDHSDWQRPERYRPSVWTWPLRALAFHQVRRGRPNWLHRRFWYCGEEAAPVYMLPGSCLFVRSWVLEQMGGLDETTFLYGEEAILSERIRDLGLTEWYVPSIQIYHKWSRSVGQGGLEHLIRSTVYFFRQYRRTGAVGMFVLKLNLLTMAAYRVVRGVEPRRWSSAVGLWRVVREA